jgi:Zn-finger nucleic acid-binding protein
MNCPVCTSELRPIDRGGIEIDVCPLCRGVWLDRGELDKLITAASRHYSGRHSDDDSDFGDDDDDRRYRNGSGPGSPYRPPGDGHPPPPGYGEYPKKKKKKGFFGDLFDFD